jgi:hypothetical protein
VPFLAQLVGGPSRWQSPRYSKRIRAANKLAGNARFAAFGKIDLELMRDVAPFAAMRTYNNRFLFSSRVNPRSLVYSASTLTGASRRWR